MSHRQQQQLVVLPTEGSESIHFLHPHFFFFFYILHSTLFSILCLTSSLLNSRTLSFNSPPALPCNSFPSPNQGYNTIRSFYWFPFAIAQAWQNYETSVCVPWTGPLDQQEQREKSGFRIRPSIPCTKKRKKKSGSTDRGREASTTQRGEE